MRGPGKLQSMFAIGPVWPRGKRSKIRGAAGGHGKQCAGLRLRRGLVVGLVARALSTTRSHSLAIFLCGNWPSGMPFYYAPPRCSIFSKQDSRTVRMVRVLSVSKASIRGSPSTGGPNRLDCPKPRSRWIDAGGTAGDRLRCPLVARIFSLLHVAKGE